MTSPGRPTWTWDQVLGHRPPYERPVFGERLGRHTSPDVLAAALADLGLGLTAAVVSQHQHAEGSPEPEWIAACGGGLGAVLVLAEVHAYIARSMERVAATRADLVRHLLQDASVVEVAAGLHITRAAVYKTAKQPGTASRFAYDQTLGGPR